MPQTKPPLTLDIRLKDRELYTELSASGPLAGISNQALFMMAMAYGYNHRTRKSVEGQTGTYGRWEYLSAEQIAIMKAVAIEEYGDLTIIEDNKAVAKLAEEYANGGIHKLKADIHAGEFGSFDKRLEVKLRELLDGDA